MAGWLRTVFGKEPKTRKVAGNVPLWAERRTQQPTAPNRSLQGQPAPVTREPRPSEARRSPGSIYRSDYLTPEREAELFRLGDEGMPTGFLAVRADRLVLVPDSKPREMVNPKSARLFKLGIYSFAVRGTSHHKQAVRTANLRPGQKVRLVREPTNPYDPNAIAIYAEKGRNPIGYVNKQNAARLAKLMDAGTDIAAISTRGNGPGTFSIVPMVLAARSEVLSHLMRKM